MLRDEFGNVSYALFMEQYVDDLFILPGIFFGGSGNLGVPQPEHVKGSFNLRDHRTTVMEHLTLRGRLYLKQEIMDLRVRIACLSVHHHVGSLVFFVVGSSEVGALGATRSDLRLKKGASR